MFTMSDSYDGPSADVLGLTVPGWYYLALWTTWQFGVVVTVFAHINEGTLRWAWLILQRMTICGYIILVYNQPPRPT